MRRPSFGEKLLLFVMFSLLVTLLACGNSDEDELSEVQRQEEQEREEQQEEGRYRAVLRSVNPDVREAEGHARIEIYGDTLKAEVIMKKVPANVLHPQHIYLGSSCPDQRDDTNKDGYIDVIEGSRLYGKIIIPLDRDLDSQEEGEGWFPIGSRYGKYKYLEKTSRAEAIADLYAFDTNPNDMIAKLDADESLNLAGRVIVIHGVQGYIGMPASVQTAWGFPNYKTLPIACGRILRMEAEEERPYDHDFPERKPPYRRPHTTGGHGHTTGGGTTTTTTTTTTGNTTAPGGVSTTTSGGTTDGGLGTTGGTTTGGEATTTTTTGGETGAATSTTGGTTTTTGGSSGRWWWPW
jgi:hypothetical protein